MHRFPVDGSHVAVARDVGPVFGEDALAEGIDLDLPGDTESGALKSKIESSDPCEEAPDRQHNPAYQTLIRFDSTVIPVEFGLMSSNCWDRQCQAITADPPHFIADRRL